MNYVNFKDKIKLSQLGMGVMRLPEKESEGRSTIDDSRAQEIIDYCMEQGVNYYDTAYIYHSGQSEAFLGRALSKYPRDSFYVADKYNLQAKPDYAAQFEEQLGRLNMDYIDFYLLHGISDHLVAEFLSNGCIEYFAELKGKGRIKHFGFSFHGSPNVLRQVIEHRPWDFAQIQLNYYDWFHGTAKEQYNLLWDKKIPVMVMEPVHGGMLASLTDGGNAILLEKEPDRSVASWAMRFVAGLPGTSVVLSGMSNIDQVKDNIKTVNEGKELTSDDMDALAKASALLHAEVAAPCTSCRYCCGSCPCELDIPALLGLYNEYKTGGEWRLNRLEALPKERRPAACVDCGACAGHCPQNLDIPGFMKEMGAIKP